MNMKCHRVAIKMCRVIHLITLGISRVQQKKRHAKVVTRLVNRVSYRWNVA